MKKIAAFILLFPVFLYGQVIKNANSGPIEGKLSLAGGMHYANIASLNQYLSDAGLPRQELPFYQLGFIYQVMVQGVISDLEFHWSFNQGQANDTYQVNYLSDIQLFNLGYMLINSPFVHLYPLVGIGRGSVRLESAQIAAPGFSQVLSNGVDTFRLENTGVLINLALGLDFLIPVGTGQDAIARFMNIGLRGGYLLDYSDSTWDSAGLEVSGGPAKLLEGAYVRLLLGVAI